MAHHSVVAGFVAILSVVSLSNADGDTVATWLQHLRSRDEAVRTAAAYGLESQVQLQAEEAMLLVSALKDHEAFVRRYVAAALGDLGLSNDEVIRPLIGALSDQDAYVRRQAAVALSKIGPPAIPLLIEKLKSLPPKEFAKHGGGEATGLVFALSNNGDAIVEPLIAAVQQSATHRRKGVTDKFEACAKLLLSDVGLPAVHSLARLLMDQANERFALSVLQDISPINVLALQWNADGREVRKCARKYLPSADGTFQYTTKCLAEELTSPNTSVRRAAVKAISDGPSKLPDELIMPLLDVAVFDPNKDARAAASLLFTTRSDAEISQPITDKLLQVLRNSDSKRRPKILPLLTKFATRDALPVLLGCLHDPNCRNTPSGDLTDDLIKSIERIDRSEAIAAVVAMVPAENNEFSKEIEAQALGRWGPSSRKALPTLVTWLYNLHYVEFVDPIIKMGRDGVDALLSILKDGAVSAEIKENICAVIGARGLTREQYVREAIRPLLQNRDRNLRFDAAVALAKGGDIESARHVILERFEKVAPGNSVDSNGSPIEQELLMVVVRNYPEAILKRLKPGAPDTVSILDTITKSGVTYKQFVSPLLVLLRSDDQNAPHAADVLGQFKFEERIVQALREQLKEPERYLRRACLTSLGRFTGNAMQVDPFLRKPSNDQSVDEAIELAAEQVEDALVPPEGLGAGEILEGSLPEFPWPPPRYSTVAVFGRDCPQDLIGNDQTTLGEIYHRLFEALLACDSNFESGLFAVPGGFLVLAKMERVDADGTPLPGKLRWTMGKLVPQSLADLISQLFLERAGYFRVIAFAITDQINFGSSEKKLPELRDVGTLLPAGIAALPLKGRHCYALIYSFEKKPGASSVSLGANVPSARIQLAKAGILDALDHLK